MKSVVRFSVLLTVGALCFLLFTEYGANAQCPPGTHWSYRYQDCMPNWRQPPPPPPGPPPGQGCNWSYRNCLVVCGGVPDCVNNCNIGYSMCVQQRNY